VLQRNISGGPLIIPSIPATVPPECAVDHDEPLAGFEPLDAPSLSDEGDKSESEEPKAKPPKTKSHARAGSGSDAEEATTK
jgi:hypothetical protein